jgi:hypothetical protein
MTPLRVPASLALTPWLAAGTHTTPAPAPGDLARLAYPEEEGSGRTITDIRASLDPDSPRWFHAMTWLLETSDTHIGGSASALRQSRGGLTLGWLERFPAADAGKLRKIAAELRADGVKAEDAGKFLAPLEAEGAPAGLRPPAADFGARQKAEPEFASAHPVKRALDILARTSLRGEPWVGRLTALDRHANAAVRQAARLTWSRWKAREIPVERLLAIADNVDEDEPLQEAALVGLPYSDHPRVHAELHRIATIPGHAARCCERCRKGLGTIRGAPGTRQPRWPGDLPSNRDEPVKEP